ncbi:MAG: carbohydrate ABC transporter permease [Provencibacterium sp.]|jgi:multiple sugar transport system permease protein|nr:carbohydrate ABC transporter permease [Provencibacterium sp.]
MMSEQVKHTPVHFRGKRLNVRHLILHIVLLFVCFISMFPFIWMISSSLKNSSLIFSYPPQLIPNPVSFSNYPEAWKATNMSRAMLNSLFIAVTATVGNCIVSSMVAYGFAKTNFKGKAVCFMIVMSTMMVPFQVVLIPQFIIFRNFGWINTFYPLIVPQLFGTAANVFMMRQYMMKIPDDFRDSAFIDGCGHLRIWFQIILPMCVPTLVSLGVLTFMGHWNNYLGPMIYLNSRKNMTVPLVLRTFKGNYATKWNLLMAASCIALAPVIVLYTACQKFIISGIMLGGIKG